jgi:hypothetical protein
MPIKYGAGAVGGMQVSTLDKHLPVFGFRCACGDCLLVSEYLDFHQEIGRFWRVAHALR